MTEAGTRPARRADIARSLCHDAVMDVLLGLVVGLVVGAVAGVAWARSRTATITARAKAAEEKVAYVEERLTERFQALSAQALDASNQRFLELAGTRLATANAEASVHAYHPAFAAAAGMLAVALAVVVIFIRAKKEDLPAEGAVAA